MSTTKAFTLIELLIVMIIVWLLAWALLPRLLGMQSRARDLARVSHVVQIAQGVFSYTAWWQTISSGCVGAASPYASNLTDIPTDPRNSIVTAAWCPAGQYVQYLLVNGSPMVVAQMENTSFGNCSIGVSYATAVTMPTLSDSWPQYCVVIQ